MSGRPFGQPRPRAAAGPPRRPGGDQRPDAGRVHRPDQLAGPPIGTLAARYGVTAPFWFAFAGSAVFLALLWRELTKIAHTDQQAAGDLPG
jgi:hypothetical protein